MSKRGLNEKIPQVSGWQNLISCFLRAAKIMGFGGKSSDLAPLGAGLLKTLNLLVSYSLLILGDALGAALPCCGAGEAIPHSVGKTKY